MCRDLYLLLGLLPSSTNLGCVPELSPGNQGSAFGRKSGGFLGWPFGPLPNVFSPSSLLSYLSPPLLVRMSAFRAVLVSNFLTLISGQCPHRDWSAPASLCSVALAGHGGARYPLRCPWSRARPTSPQPPGPRVPVGGAQLWQPRLDHTSLWIGSRGPAISETHF